MAGLAGREFGGQGLPAGFGLEQGREWPEEFGQLVTAGLLVILPYGLGDRFGRLLEAVSQIEENELGQPVKGDGVLPAGPLEEPVRQIHETGKREMVRPNPRKRVDE